MPLQMLFLDDWQLSDAALEFHWTAIFPPTVSSLSNSAKCKLGAPLEHFPSYDALCALQTLHKGITPLSVSLSGFIRVKVTLLWFIIAFHWATRYIETCLWLHLEWNRATPHGWDKNCHFHFTNKEISANNFRLTIIIHVKTGTQEPYSGRSSCLPHVLSL